MSDSSLKMFSVSPHFRAKNSTSSLMFEVIFALIPAVAASFLNFGLRSLILIGLSVITAVLSELLFQKLSGQKVRISDCSAILTGLLLAMNLPVSVPWWIPVVGSAFAIIVVKQFFGGIGQNFVNPALAARCFLLISWTSLMTDFSLDGVAQATPLTMAESGAAVLPDYMECFLGNTAGCLGETSALFLLIGGLYLIAARVIDFRIPLSFIGTVFVLSFVFGMDGLYQILNGGLFLGAFFMATDYVTTPMNRGGRWIFGIGCGLITVLIRRFGSYPEGVSFAILLMNICTPLIDRFVKPRVYGISRKSAKRKGEAQ